MQEEELTGPWLIEDQEGRNFWKEVFFFNSEVA